MRYSAPGVVVDFAELSDPGRDPTKQVNEDTCLARATAHGFLAVVCDGMGGHEGGRLASQTAVTTILNEVEASSSGEACGAILARAVRSAGRAVYALGGDGRTGSRPGSTCVAALLGQHGTALAHVGDSRIYRVRNASFRRLTRDHSIVQHLIDSGSISAADAMRHPEANRITRALGVAPEVEVEVQESALLAQTGDLFLLCSDGLTDLALDEELGEVVQNPPGDLESICRRLVDLANARGGHDNITVQMFTVLEAPVLAGPNLGQTLLESQSAALNSGGIAKTMELQSPVAMTQVDAPRAARDLALTLPSDPTPGPAPHGPSYVTPPQGHAVWPHQRSGPTTRPVPWVLLLLIVGTLALGALLGAGLLFWWLTHTRCPDEHVLDGPVLAEQPMPRHFELVRASSSPADEALRPA